MKKKLAHIFFRALLQILKSLWALLLLILHICAKTLEVSASLITKITSSLLNKN